MKMLGVCEAVSPSRTDQNTKGRYYSFVIFGKCNFRCNFCFVGGNKIRNANAFQKAKEMSLIEVKRFVIDQCAKGNPIRFTGGEPTLFPNELSLLIDTAKDFGGYICVSTNGSRPDVLNTLLGKLDEVVVGFKGAPPDVVKLTNRKSALSWSKPVQTLEILKTFTGNVQVNSVISKATRYEELCTVAYHMPTNASWRLKSFLPIRISYARKGQQVAINKRTTFEPVSDSILRTYVERLRREFPALKIMLETAEIEKKLKVR